MAKGHYRRIKGGKRVWVRASGSGGVKKPTIAFSRARYGVSGIPSFDAGEGARAEHVVWSNPGWRTLRRGKKNERMVFGKRRRGGIVMSGSGHNVSVATYDGRMVTKDRFDLRTIRGRGSVPASVAQANRKTKKRKK